VIDAERQAIYVVARTKEHETNFVQKLHALSLRDGSELLNSPVTILASCPGNAVDATNHMIVFDSTAPQPANSPALVRGVVVRGLGIPLRLGPIPRLVDRL
jgi:hypothetical protein